MGDSHVKSNVVGKNGTESISNFASIGAVALTSSGAIEGTHITANSYVTVGSRYIFVGSTGETSASVVALGSSLVGAASKAGSLYLGTKLWQFDADSTATKLG
jgi:hypothetical protein